MRNLRRADIRCVYPEGKLSLGALRNLSLSAASGELVCQWDDDDLHHPRRLEVQAKALVREGASAVYLQNVLHFFRDQQICFWTDWSRSSWKCHAATFLARKDHGIRYPETGEQSIRGEDTFFLKNLRENGKVVYLETYPYLYVYVFHGTNTWHAQHHLGLAHAYGVTKTLIVSQWPQLAAGLRGLDFGAPYVHFVSQAGPVFMWMPNSGHVVNF